MNIQGTNLNNTTIPVAIYNFLGNIDLDDIVFLIFVRLTYLAYGYRLI